MTASPFEKLPEELRLKIFRFTKPWYGHMTNLRLVCKTFVPTATELLFEQYKLVLWLLEDGIFGEQRSFQLLKENPRYGALVKDVKILYAIDDTYSIQYGLGLRYHTMTGEMQKTKILSTMCKALRTTEDVIPAPIKESIEPFYARFGENLDASYGYGEPRWSSLLFEMKSRLDLFPNARSLGVRNAYFHETPLFSEIAQFWKETGLPEPWNICFASMLVGSRSFTWRFEAMQVGLKVFEDLGNITQLAFKVCPFQRFPGQNWNTLLSDVFTLRPESFKGVKTLKVDVWPLEDLFSTGNADVAWRPALQWVRFIQKFQSITTLELINDSVETEFNSEDVVVFNTFRDFPNLLFAQVRMPSLEKLRLRGWAVHLRRLIEISKNFPNLQLLNVSVMALLGLSMKRNLSMWYEAAEALGAKYQGKCALHFNGNPIMEIEADYGDNTYSVYSINRRIIAFLAVPAQDVLTAVSRQAKTEDQLYQAYKDMITHERPKRDSRLTTDPELPVPVRDPFVEVRTPGMLARYYNLESDQPDVTSADGSDTVQ